MLMVKGFDIDTVEGSRAYLESEGIDVDNMVNVAMKMLVTNNALDRAYKNKEFTDGFCKFCKSAPCQHLAFAYDDEE